MQIKPSESAATARSASTRPATTGPLALEAKARSVSIALSGSVRALAAALTHEQLDLRALRLGEKLTGTDLLLLAKVSELASAEQLDPGEVVKLALDLSRYRAPADAPRPPPQALLALPTFSPRDETLARSILSSVALRSTALERGFVRALLDPDQTPEHAVDFEFLRRAVLALSAAPGDEALDGSVSFERRDARAALADALQALALPRAELPSGSEPHVDLGAALLRRRLPAALGHSDAPANGTAWSPSASRAPLTREDRALLGVLYAAAYARGQSLDDVDDVARALVRLRVLERASAPSEPRVSNASAQLEPGEPDASAQTAIPVAELPDARVQHDRIGLERPHTSAAAGPAIAAHELEPPPTDDATNELLAELSPPLARSFGSASQLAARAGGTYRSVAPPALALAGAFLGGSAEAGATPGAVTAQRAASALLFAPRLDLAGALGLSSLIRDVRLQALRAARARLPAHTVHAIEAPAKTAPEAAADDPLSDDGSPRRKHARWLLLSRRRRARSRGNRLP